MLTAYAHCSRRCKAAAADFTSVRLCASAGEALPASVFERWREKTGLEIFDGIGSTEICHMFLSNRAGAVRAGSSGTPVSGYEVRIADESGREAATGEIGDLLVKGDSTMAFYWNKHEATKRTVKGDWIQTGDKYRRDAEALLARGELTMLEGRRPVVSPVEVEVALTHPAVLEAQWSQGTLTVSCRTPLALRAEGRRREDLERSSRPSRGEARTLPGPSLGHIRAGASQDRNRQDPALCWDRSGRRRSIASRRETLSDPLSPRESGYVVRGAPAPVPCLEIERHRSRAASAP